MSKEKKKKSSDRIDERRRGTDRRKTFIDPKDLPFPDRRVGDRRQKDRRIWTEEEREELLKRIKEHADED